LLNQSYLNLCKKRTERKTKNEVTRITEEKRIEDIPRELSGRKLMGKRIYLKWNSPKNTTNSTRSVWSE